MMSQGTGGCSSTEGEPTDLRIGSLIDGRYRLGAHLGAGAMGIVYDGVHEGLGRRVALKILRREHRSEVFPLETFHREARTLAAIANPHIVAVHDIGELDEGRAYVVTEHLDGEELSSVLDERGWLGWREAVELALQVCDGMSAAHRAGIIHRDLKPENLFLVRSGPPGAPACVKILDFGVAKLLGAPSRAVTFAGRLAGTPEYMAPEQCRGLDVDERVDVYALGVLLFEMVTGRLPFVGTNPFRVLQQQVEAPVPSLATAADPRSVPDELDALVRRCLAKDRADRFASMEALAEALYALVADAEDTVPSEPPVAWVTDPEPGPTRRLAPALPVPLASIQALGALGVAAGLAALFGLSLVAGATLVNALFGAGEASSAAPAENASVRADDSPPSAPEHLEDRPSRRAAPDVAARPQARVEPTFDEPGFDETGFDETGSEAPGSEEAGFDEAGSEEAPPPAMDDRHRERARTPERARRTRHGFLDPWAADS